MLDEIDAELGLSGFSDADEWKAPSDTPSCTPRTAGKMQMAVSLVP